MSKKFCRRFCLRRFRKSGGEEFSAVIVGTADKNLFPRFRVSRGESVAIGEFLNFFRCQFAKQCRRQIAEEGITQSIGAFKMFKEQNETLEMRGVELTVDAVERVGDGVSDAIFGQVFLQLENVTAKDGNILVLGLSDIPNQ